MQAALPSDKFTDSLRLPRSSSHRKPVRPQRSYDQRRSPDDSTSDDSSSSTTFSVNNGAIKECQPPAPPTCRWSPSPVTANSNSATTSRKGRKKRQRVVKFNETANLQHVNHAICHEEVNEFWYSADDCVGFKKAASNAIHRLWEAEVENQRTDRRSYLNILEGIYQLYSSSQYDPSPAAGSTSSLQNNNNNNRQEGSSALSSSINNNLSDLPTHLQESLMALYQVDGNIKRVGLEKFASDFIRRDRDKRRQRMFLLVDTLQDKYDMARYRGDDDFADSLRKVCMNISLPSRKFAELLASAQCSYDK